ncbi:MAG: RNA polymerase [Thermoplasmata archaeon]|nr:RNA polymerase [Thermoplasmata archaeon]
MANGSKFVSIPEVKDILEEVGEGRELNYEQKLALEHATYSIQTTSKDANKLIKALMEHERITEALAFKIVEIWPTHPDDVKAIFAKERFTIKEEDIQDILQKVADHEKTKK